jgi:hypothetical protein
MNEEDNDKKNFPATVPERTPEGRFHPGKSGNYAGRPLSARTKFSRELIEAFARDWHKHGPEVLVRVRGENPTAYLTIAAKLVPKELLLQLERPLAEMADVELQAAALQEQREATVLIEHIKTIGGEALLEQARRDVLGEDDEDA